MIIPQFITPRGAVMPALCMLALLSCLRAAPPSYDDKQEQAVFNYFKARGGDWSKDKNWTRGHVPTAEEVAIVRDNMTAVISSKMPDVFTVAVGGQKLSALTISEGGSLTSLRKIHVNRNEKDTVAVLVMDGGYLRAGADKTFDQGLMLVGVSATHSSQGTFEMYAGTFEGGINVGAGLDTARGKVTIRGKKPVMRGVVEKRDGLAIHPTGTLEFILDADGVSTLDFSKTWAGFKKGSTLRVDGTAYRGGSQTITLIDTKRLSNQGAVVECVGFDPGKYKADIEFSPKGLLLKIKVLSK